MAEHIKVTHIYESNPQDSEENPTYCVSRVVGTIVEKLPEEIPEEIPKYIVSDSVKENDSSNSN